MRILRPYIFALMILGLLAAVTSARAQDAVLSAPTGPTLEVPTGNLSSPLAGTSADRTIKEFASALYKRCKTNPFPDLSELENEEYCVCLSAQMYRKTLTNDERAFIADGQGIPMDPKRLTAELYGQCIGVPGRAATYHKCTHTPDIFKYVKGEDELESMCQCVNNQLSHFWDVEAPAFIELHLRTRKADQFLNDLLGAVMKGRDFPVRYAEERSFCVRKYGRRD